MGTVDHQTCAHLPSPMILEPTLSIIYSESMAFDYVCQFFSDDHLGGATCIRISSQIW